MNKITITIEAPELVAALNSFAAALTGQNKAVTITQPAAPAAPAAPVTPAAPIAPPVAPPVAPVAPAAPVVTPPEYTQDQLVHAATPLIDAGRQADLIALLAQFGVQSMMQLPKEQYGAFATGLRGMGARI